MSRIPTRTLVPTTLPSAAALTLAAALALAVPLTLLAACGGGHDDGHGAETALAAVDAEVARAERLDVARTVELSGSVEADRRAVVSTRVMAQVTAVHATAGDRLRRGQPVVSIDPAAARGQLDQARGALAQARAALSLAERNYERFEALAATDAASELELDKARMDYEQAQGAVEQAEGAVATAASMAEDSTVRAPFDGRVVRRMVEVGDLAAPGRPLLILESESSRRAVLLVPESTVAATGLAVGDPVPVRVDVRPDLGVLDGRVIEMSPGSDPMAHAYEVKVELPTVDAAPLPTGTAVRARLPVGERSAVAVPAGAVLSRGGLDLVVVVDEEGRTSSRAVTLGLPLPDGRLEVLSGLKGGERVLLELADVPPAGSEVSGLGG